MRRHEVGTFGAIFVVTVLVTAVLAPPLRAEDVRAGLQSPLRTGAKPGCRWVQGAAKTTRVCNTQTGQCRLQTAPAQRIWACGTVRD